MGLATIDPHSQQEHTDNEIHKIPFKFSFKNVKINKKCMAIRTLCGTASGYSRFSCDVIVF